MVSSRWVHAALTLVLVHGLSGCAGTGPDLQGPEGPRLMAAYSGDWVLDPTRSEDLNRKLEEGMRGPGSGMTAGRPGGGMTGGRPGGGMPPGGGRPGGGMRGGMPGGNMDPEEMRRSMEAIRSLSRVPAEISLVLKPETVTFTQDAANLLILTFGSESERFVQGGATLLGQAKWTKTGLEISRTLDAGPGINDKLRIDEQGSLLLEREVDLMGRSIKGTLLYRKKG